MDPEPFGHQRRRTIILLMSLVGAQFGFLVPLLQNPTFQARASLRMETGLPRPALIDIKTVITLLEREGHSDRVYQRVAADVNIDSQRIKPAVETLRVRPIGESGYIEVLCASSDPRLAAAVANATVASYAERIGNIRLIHLAEVPWRPRPRNTHYGANVGLIGGFIAATVYLRLRTKFVVVEKRMLPTRVVGVIWSRASARVTW